MDQVGGSPSRFFCYAGDHARAFADAHERLVRAASEFGRALRDFVRVLLAGPPEGARGAQLGFCELRAASEGLFQDSTGALVHHLTFAPDGTDPN